MSNNARDLLLIPVPLDRRRDGFADSCWLLEERKDRESAGWQSGTRPDRFPASFSHRERRGRALQGALLAPSGPLNAGLVRSYIQSLLTLSFGSTHARSAPILQLCLPSHTVSIQDSAHLTQSGYHVIYCFLLTNICVTWRVLP